MIELTGRVAGVEVALELFLGTDETLSYQILRRHVADLRHFYCTVCGLTWRPVVTSSQ